MIAVLGPGGVGGLVAAALTRAGEDVVVVAREATAERIAAEGIRVRSLALGDFAARPRAVAVLSAPAEVLVVATKAPGLEAALARIAAPVGLVVPLLNGLDHLALLRGRFGRDTVCSGVIRVESDRPAPGMVVHTSPSVRVDLAPPWPAVVAVAERLTAAGLPCDVGDDEATVMWGKLIRLNALALMTSAYDLPLGPIREDPVLAAELEACVLETAAVAVACGADVDPATTLGELADAHAGLGSSMRRDIDAGREPELDAIAGAVVRAGERVGLAVPTVERLMERVRARIG